MNAAIPLWHVLTVAAPPHVSLLPGNQTIPAWMGRAM